MIECTVYFEPYYHVLKALQNMDQENLPMKEYIVDVQNYIVSPDYVQANTIITMDRYNVPLLQHAGWPSAAELQLDTTQLSAFHAAFTQKFAIIQGPPGTGKTFLGLKIAKTLIKNKHLLQVSTPILVVCFTNHALDQFLEGLIGTTEDIVRVGGQSKNEALEKFKLKNKKRRSHNVISSSTFALRDSLRQILTQIKRYQSIIEELSSYNSIINLREFFCNFDGLDDSWFSKASSQQMLEWLFGGRTPNARVEEQMKIRVEEVNINLESFCNKYIL